jgi:hypothetical protein
MPPQPLDALENLPKEHPRQVAFGELRFTSQNENAG